jgi:hypothetical protein
MLFKPAPTFATGLAILAQLQRVAAHGYVAWVSANGQTYTGFEEDQGQPSNSPVLATKYLEPLYDVWSPYVAFRLVLPIIPDPELTICLSLGESSHTNPSRMFVSLLTFLY